MQSKTDILIVEDDIVAASLLKKTLIDLGHNVIGVEVEGKKAIELIKQKKPELIMVDYQLEDNLTGADVAKAVLREQKVATIYVTSKSDDLTLKTISETNPHGYILKPFNRQEIGMVIDTVMKKFWAELALSSKNEELDQEVEATTEELKRSLSALEKEVELRKKAENQLQDALAREKEFSNIKTRLASSIAHEFKLPLTSILSSTEIIKMKLEASGDESLQKHIHRVSDGTIQLNKILSNILFLEKSGLEDAGNSPTEINISEFIEEVIAEVNQCIKKCPEIKLSIFNVPKSITVYAELLRQIVTNLTSNAAKYSNGNGTVAVNLIGKKDELLFEFVDKGIGIPKAEQERIFDYFFRASNVKKIEGNGVGLALTKSFSDLLGARLTFESQENKGTKFNLSLPLKRYES